MAIHKNQLGNNRRSAGVLLILGLLGGSVGFVLNHGNLRGEESNRQTRTIGSDRLVGFAPLPEMSGPMCEFEPASATQSLMAALGQQEARASAIP